MMLHFGQFTLTEKLVKNSNNTIYLNEVGKNGFGLIASMMLKYIEFLFQTWYNSHIRTKKFVNTHVSVCSSVSRLNMKVLIVQVMIVTVPKIVNRRMENIKRGIIENKSD